MITGVLLGAWFCASLVHQFRFTWWQRLARFDFLNLLPRWTFFAPNPGRQDLHLLYRDWVAERPGPWQELAFRQNGRRWRWLWNPARYPNKAVSDLVQGLLVNAPSLDSDAPHLIMLSGSYLGLLALVREQPPASCPGSKRQFAIVATQGFGEQRSLQLKYLSECHRAES